MEAEEGIEPSNDGFANHCLTTWLLRRTRFGMREASDYVFWSRVSMPGFTQCEIDRSDRMSEFVRLSR